MASADDLLKGQQELRAQMLAAKSDLGSLGERLAELQRERDEHPNSVAGAPVRSQGHPIGPLTNALTDELGTPVIVEIDDDSNSGVSTAAAAAAAVPAASELAAADPNSEVVIALEAEKAARDARARAYEQRMAANLPGSPANSQASPVIQQSTVASPVAAPVEVAAPVPVAAPAPVAAPVPAPAEVPVPVAVAAPVPAPVPAPAAAPIAAPAPVPVAAPVPAPVATPITISTPTHISVKSRHINPPNLMFESVAKEADKEKKGDIATKAKPRVVDDTVSPVPGSTAGSLPASTPIETLNPLSLPSPSAMANAFTSSITKTDTDVKPIMFSFPLAKASFGQSIDGETFLLSGENSLVSGEPGLLRLADYQARFGNDEATKKVIVKYWSIGSTNKPPISKKTKDETPLGPDDFRYPSEVSEKATLRNAFTLYRNFLATKAGKKNDNELHFKELLRLVDLYLQGFDKSDTVTGAAAEGIEAHELLPKGPGPGSVDTYYSVLPKIFYVLYQHAKKGTPVNTKAVFNDYSLIKQDTEQLLKIIKDDPAAKSDIFEPVPVSILRLLNLISDKYPGIYRMHPTLGSNKPPGDKGPVAATRAPVPSIDGDEELNKILTKLFGANEDNKKAALAAFSDANAKYGKEDYKGALEAIKRALGQLASFIEGNKAQAVAAAINDERSHSEKDKGIAITAALEAGKVAVKAKEDEAAAALEAEKAKGKAALEAAVKVETDKSAATKAALDAALAEAKAAADAATARANKCDADLAAAKAAAGADKDAAIAAAVAARDEAIAARDTAISGLAAKDAEIAAARRAAEVSAAAAATGPGRADQSAAALAAEREKAAAALEAEKAKAAAAIDAEKKKTDDANKRATDAEAAAAAAAARAGTAEEEARDANARAQAAQASLDAAQRAAAGGEAGAQDAIAAAQAAAAEARGAAAAASRERDAAAAARATADAAAGAATGEAQTAQAAQAAAERERDEARAALAAAEAARGAAEAGKAEADEAANELTGERDAALAAQRAAEAAAARAAADGAAALERAQRDAAAAAAAAEAARGEAGGQAAASAAAAEAEKARVVAAERARGEAATREAVAAAEAAAQRDKAAILAALKDLIGEINPTLDVDGKDRLEGAIQAVKSAAEGENFLEGDKMKNVIGWLNHYLGAAKSNYDEWVGQLNQFSQLSADIARTKLQRDDALKKIEDWERNRPKEAVLSHIVRMKDNLINERERDIIKLRDAAKSGRPARNAAIVKQLQDEIAEVRKEYNELFKTVKFSSTGLRAYPEQSGGSIKEDVRFSPNSVREFAEEQAAWEKANDAYNAIPDSHRHLLPGPGEAPALELVKTFNRFIDENADEDPINEARDAVGMLSHDDLDEIMNSDSELESQKTEYIKELYGKALPDINEEWLPIIVKADITAMFL